MRRFIALLLMVLLMASMFAVNTPTAYAASSWKDLYAQYLQQCYKTFKNSITKIPVEYVSFADFNRDGTPEMLVVLNNGTTGTNLAKLFVFTIDGGKVVQTGKTLDLGKRALGLSIQYCEHSSSKAWLVTSTCRGADNSKIKVIRKVAGSDSVALFKMRQAAGKTEYAVSKSGASKIVSRSVYASEYRSFLTSVKKLGGACPVVRVKGASLASLKSAMKSAASKYAKYTKVSAVRMSIGGKYAKGYTISVGELLQLGFAVKPASALVNLTVTSSNSEVILVNNNTMQIKTLQPGTVVLRVKDARGASSSVRVKVVAE